MEIITTHINADFDALASMVAAQKLYPQAEMVFPGSQEENVRQYLAERGIYLRFTKANKIDLDTVTRLIIVDTAWLSRLGPLAPLVGKPGVEVQVYDHHPLHQGDIHGQVENIRETGACTTLLIESLQQRNIPVTPDEATLLALGIYEDTGMLTFISTTPDDLKAAAVAISWGASLNLINTYIRRELTPSQVSLLDTLIHNVQSIYIHEVEVTISTASIEDYTGDIAVMAHKLRDILDVNVLFILIHIEDRIHLVARSGLQAVNVAEVAGALGGGGHHSAASASLHNMSLEQAQEKLLEVLYRHIPPARVAEHFMTSPAKYVRVHQPLEQVRELFTRYNINNMPVVGENDQLVGVISRQIVDRAISHNLKDIPVGEYMQSDVPSISVQADIAAIKTLMLEHQQPLLPVVEQGKVAGVITRTDLLRMLHEDMAASRHTPLLKGHVPKHTAVSGKALGFYKDMTPLLKERLPGKVLNVLKLVGEVADELGYGAYAVGGMVRDLLLRVENYDVDVVVEQNGIELARVLAGRVKGYYKTHTKFGTAMVIFPDGFKLDVATARIEYYTHPAALPIVEQSSIKQDLYRRDFTINSLAIKLNAGEFGRLLDFFGGQADLKNGIIRVLHSLSLVDDPSRVLRAVRFEQRFSFRIGKHTLNLIHHAAKRNLPAQLAGTRLMQELRLIFDEPYPDKSISRMAELDLLKFLHPALKSNYKLLELCQNIRTVIDWYNLLYLPDRVDHYLVYLLGLTDQLTATQTQEMLRRLELGDKRIHLVQFIREQTPHILNRFSRKKNPPPSFVYRLLEPIPLEGLIYVMAKSGRDDIKQKISLYLTQWRKVSA